MVAARSKRVIALKEYALANQTDRRARRRTQLLVLGAQLLDLRALLFDHGAFLLALAAFLLIEAFIVRHYIAEKLLQTHKARKFVAKRIVESEEM